MRSLTIVAMFLGLVVIIALAFPNLILREFDYTFGRTVANQREETWFTIVLLGVAVAFGFWRRRNAHREH